MNERFIPPPRDVLRILSEKGGLSRQWHSVILTVNADQVESPPQSMLTNGSQQLRTKHLLLIIVI